MRKSEKRGKQACVVFCGVGNYPVDRKPCAAFVVSRKGCRRGARGCTPLSSPPPVAVPVETIAVSIHLKRYGKLSCLQKSSVPLLLSRGTSCWKGRQGVVHLRPPPPAAVPAGTTPAFIYLKRHGKLFCLQKSPIPLLLSCGTSCQKGKQGVVHLCPPLRQPCPLGQRSSPSI